MRYLTNLSNYYGTVCIYEKNNKYYWELEDYGDIVVEEIPEYLFIAIKEFINKGL